MRKSRIAGVFILLFALLFFFSTGCERLEEKKPAVPAGAVKFGITPTVFSAPVIIAMEKGYFAEEGIAVDFRKYPFGKVAMEGFLAGEVDVTTVGDTPIVFSSMKRDDFLIFSTFVSAYDHSKIIARKDRGISKPSDLKRKKIGTTLGSTAHFYLSVFLNSHGMSASDITVANLAQNDLAAALADGKVDAVVAFEPFAYQALKPLQEKAFKFPKTTMFRETYSLVSRKNLAQKEPDILKKILRVIDRSIEFMRRNRQESISIVAKSLKTDTEFLSAIWDNYNFGLTLDQSLIMTLEDEARWAIKNKLTDKKDIPNYLDYIYMGALKEVKPEAVTVIR